MSGLMHKVKDALSGEKNTPEAAAANKGNNEYGSGTQATHSGIGHSSTSGDPLHSGKGTTLSGNDMTGRTTDSSGYGSHSAGTATAGPHSSNLANKADPRVDSDLDGSRRDHGTTGAGMTGSHTTGSHMTGGSGNNTGSGLTGSGTGSGYGSSGYGSTGSTTAGPHSSNLANKADPRVDSDLDGGRGTHGTTGSGLTGSHGTTSTHGTTGGGLTGSGTGSGYGSSGYDRTTGGSGLTGSGTTGTGYDGSSGYGSNTGSSTTAGPHSSNLANKADPRVDSDRDGKRGLESTSGTHGTTGSGLTGSSTTGHHGHHGGALGKAEDIIHGGEHHTETANRLDPHVSGGRGGLEHATVEGTGSGLGGSSGMTGHGTSGTTGGYGSSSGTTAGPHSSNLANKADPRVDSDLDGRRGMETTSGSHGTTGGYGSSTGAHGTGTHGTTGEYGSSTGAYGSTSGTSAGPHSSNLANKADPRVDSDLDGRRGMETSSGAHGTTGTHGTSGTHGNTGGYGSSTTSSGAYGSGTGVGGTSGGYGSNTTGSGYNDNTSSTTGTGSTTAGPHKSNMTNKLDPRVDSDMDGSRMK
ncbi:MAG: hypothetical protein Q9170_003480 [Blastenia crenularia]